jgi:hypothetical protein
MAHSRRLKTLVLAALSGFVAPAAASAQASVYVSGSVFADVREFGDVGVEGLFGSGSLGSLDATGVGGSFRVGTWLHPRWTLELGLDLATTTTVDYEDDVVIAIFPPPPPITYKTSSDFTTVTAMVGFHQPVSNRVQLGYLVGFAFVRRTSTIESSLLDPRILAALDLQAPAISQSTNSGAAALGLEATFAVTPLLAIVPELRVLVPTNPSSTFLIRPAAGVRWSF